MLHIFVLHNRSQFNCLLKIVSRRKKKSQKKRKFRRLDNTLTDFFIGDGNTANTLENEASESQASDHHENFDRIVYNASQNQVLESNTDNKIRNAIDSAVIAVENRIHDAISTAMNNVVIPQVEMAVRSIRGSYQEMDPKVESRTLIEDTSEGTLKTLRSGRPLVD